MTTSFRSLLADLEGGLNKPLADLSRVQQARIRVDFPMPWDKMSPEQRRTVAKQWDYQNDPATEEERERLFELCDKRGEIENEISKLEAMSVPTPLDRESRERQLIDLRVSLKDVKAQLAALLTEPATQVGAVSRQKIIAAFAVKQTPDMNISWWKVRMRDAKRYGLLECRAALGRGKRSSRWYPHVIAGWLIEKKHMTSTQVQSAARKHFPEHEENIALVAASQAPRKGR